MRLDRGDCGQPAGADPAGRRGHSAVAQLCVVPRGGHGRRLYAALRPAARGTQLRLRRRGLRVLFVAAHARDPVLQSEQPDRDGLLRGGDARPAPPDRAARPVSALRRGIQGFRLWDAAGVEPGHAGRDRGPAPPRGAHLHVLQGVRDDRLAGRVSAFGRAYGPRHPDGPRRPGHVRAGGVAVRRAGRARIRRRAHRHVPAGVQGSPRPDAHPAGPPVARLRLPEAGRRVLRLSARQGRGRAGPRLAGAGRRPAPQGQGRRRAGRRVRPQRRGPPAIQLRPRVRRDRGRIRAADRLFPVRGRAAHAASLSSGTSRPSRFRIPELPARSPLRTDRPETAWRRGPAVARLGTYSLMASQAARHRHRRQPRQDYRQTHRQRVVRAALSRADQPALVQYRRRPAAGRAERRTRFAAAAGCDA